jgi:hypothetical protein
MVGSQASGMIMNPKFLAKGVWFALCCFAAYHGTKLGFAMFTGFLVGRFGRPTLIRETSKIYT